tara:strand:+ start:8314 stop:8574 length:261 start_codon:yes stop_codon:yes gene_type:complete
VSARKKQRVWVIEILEHRYLENLGVSGVFEKKADAMREARAWVKEAKEDWAEDISAFEPRKTPLGVEERCLGDEFNLNVRCTEVQP